MTLIGIKANKAYKMHYKDWADLKAKQSKDGLEVTMNEIAELYSQSQNSELLDKVRRMEEELSDETVKDELIESTAKENLELHAKITELESDLNKAKELLSKSLTQFHKYEYGQGERHDNEIYQDIELFISK